MSIARGDLTRRAALADNLAVPEPWSSNDDPRVFAAIRDLRDEFRRLGITDEDGKGRLPDFLLDYENLPPIKPTTLDRAHTRNSSATRWDQNGNLVEDSSDTLRLQRDPATQEPLGLLYEPKRTQLLNDTNDPSNWSVIDSPLSLNADAGTAKGQPFSRITLSGNQNGDAIKNINTNSGEPVSYSTIIRLNNNVQTTDISLFINDSADGNRVLSINLSDGTITSEPSSKIETSVKDIGGGWYYVKFSYDPGSNTVEQVRLRLEGDGTEVDLLHAQAEVSREVTTPILSGSATRGADEVDYRFDFPNKTTGVGYSILQECGDNPAFFGYTNFGPTNTNFKAKQHGVLMDGGGLDRDIFDGWKLKTRNSDDDSTDGSDPNAETITRFQQHYQDRPQDPIRIIRQIAIHRQPHTQAQKDTLRDQYLTQP